MNIRYKTEENKNIERAYITKEMWVIYRFHILILVFTLNLSWPLGILQWRIKNNKKYKSIILKINPDHALLKSKFRYFYL